MSKTKNGCPVVKETAGHVLCLWPSEVSPYVVWAKDAKGRGVSQGNYVCKLSDALRVLSERSGIPENEL